MKRSELKNIVKEIAELEIGKTQTDPETGVKTTLTNIDPETGRHEWDVKYDVDPKFLYNKLEDLVKYLDKAEKGSELAQFRDILKNLKNRTARIIPN
jgi:hypothetical protein